MRRWLVLLMVVVAILGIVAPVSAHPAPFSFADIRIRPGSIDMVLVVHVFDAAHELGIQPPELLLDPAILGPQAKRLWALLRDRLHVAADRRPLELDTWSSLEPLPDRQAVRLRIHREMGRTPGVLDVSANLFPYDPVHQTFLNIYEGDALTSQTILSQGRTEFEYFAGTRQGTLAVVRKFVPVGVHHILIGPDHLLFLVGLLLLGGSFRRLLIVVSAFVVDAAIGSYLSQHPFLQSFLATLLGVSPWVVIIVLGVAALVWLWRSPRTVESGKWSWPITGVIVGALAVLGWYTSTFGDAPTGITFAINTSHIFTYPLIRYPNRVNWSMLLLIGVPVGAFVAAWRNGEFAWKLPQGFTIAQLFAGGLIMGVGAILAEGCNITQGLTNSATLALGSLVAFGAMILGAWVTVRVMFLRGS